MSQEFNTDALKEWFFLNKRDLPWRQNPSPYEVWISEVMLQQTQVSVVVPYFKKWMERFKTVNDLAKASLGEVMKTWEGLGYYSRARHLHEGAKQIVEKYEGHIPSHRKELEEIKGMGPYTVGAILSFAFRQKAIAMDANVVRVIARYFHVEEEISLSSTKKRLNDLVWAILPDEEPWIVAEALIELGALVCQKNPECDLCPLKRTCLAAKTGSEKILPVKKKRVSTTLLYRVVVLIFSQKQIVLEKREQGEVMAGLWEFPYFDIPNREIDYSEIQKKIKDRFGMDAVYHKTLEEETHTFTRYKAFLFPTVWYLPEENKNHTFFSLQSARSLPLSSGHRRIFNQVEKNFF